MRAAIRDGVRGGLLGGVVIWIYEAIVWVGIQHLLPLSGIPANATGLVFGKAVQTALGPLAHLLGISIHFGFAAFWGVVFALSWPTFKKRKFDATLVALVYAVIIWIVMHIAIAVASSTHPDYLDPVVVIGGFSGGPARRPDGAPFTFPASTALPNGISSERRHNQVA